MNVVRATLLCVILFAPMASASNYKVDTYASDLVAITHFFNELLSEEATALESEVSPSITDEELEPVILQHRDHFIVRCKDSFNQELTPEQRTLCLRLLSILDALAQTTTQELMEMATVHDNLEQLQRCNFLFEQYYKEHCGSISDCKHLNAIQAAVMLDKILLMQTGNKTYDKVIRFMCHCAYLNDFCALMDYEEQETATNLQLMFTPVMEAINTTFIVFNNSYYYPEWQNQFIKNGTIFAHTHDVTSQLLAALSA